MFKYTFLISIGNIWFMKVHASKLSIITVLVITLIFFPINHDALIIPKLALFFTVAMIFIPLLLKDIKNDFTNKKYLLLYAITTLIIIQLILAMIMSQAPFEQEFFGRTGRGLGFITFFSSLIFILINIKFAQIKDGLFLIKILMISGFLSSGYALAQQFGWDIFNWTTRTNGIIGTIGNPNFQSSFTAMSFAAAIVYCKLNFTNPIPIVISIIVFFSTIYFAQATQGYIIIGTSIIVFLLIWLYYKNKKYFTISFLFVIIAGLLVILGMLNKGPLSYFLYKISVVSRGDFWRSALATANSHPIFGVGLDSFGDYFLIYRDKPKIEMTDNAHNYFLELAATGGYPLAILYFIMTSLVLINFFQLQKKLNKFDPILTSIFCAWLGFQMQSVVSPGTIALIAWNSVLSGFIIGANYKYNTESELNPKLKTTFQKQRLSGISYLLGIVGFVLIFPLFNSDRELMKGVKNKDANQLINALTLYPESSIKYNIFIQELLRSNLLEQSLEVSRRAIKFNPNAVSAWALIFINPKAPLNERIQAKTEILRLDPLNTEVFDYKLE